MRQHGYLGVTPDGTERIAFADIAPVLSDCVELYDLVDTPNGDPCAITVVQLGKKDGFLYPHTPDSIQRTDKQAAEWTAMFSRPYEAVKLYRGQQIK